MANNLTQLKLDIKNISINGSLDPFLDTIIASAEDYLENVLVTNDSRLPEMEALLSYTPAITSGTNNIPLPSDYLEMIYLQITDQLPSPVVTLSSAAGTLLAGTYYYRVTAINANGETLGSEEKSIILGATSGVKIDWVQVTNATGYKVYGRSAGAELLITTILSGATITYTDSGSITPSGALTINNTTGLQRYNVFDRNSNKKFVDNYLESINTTTNAKERPKVYTRIGNKLFFDVYTDKDYAYEISYIKKITQLSDTNQTNYWTNNYYFVLRMAAMMECEPYLVDDPRFQKWEVLRDRKVMDMLQRIKMEKTSGGRDWRGRSVIIQKDGFAFPDDNSWA